MFLCARSTPSLALAAGKSSGGSTSLILALVAGLLLIVVGIGSLNLIRRRRTLSVSTELSLTE